MRYQNVESAPQNQLRHQLEHALLHFPFGILMCARLILHAAAQTENPDAVMDVDLVFYADASLRLLARIAGIMIAMNIQDGSAREAGQEGQIRRGQIAAGDDQINPLQPALVQMIP